MPTFVVECYWPGITEVQASAALTRVEDPIQALGCILVPSDGMAIFLFWSPSSIRLSETSRLAELPFDRIVESVHVGFGRGGSEAKRRA